MVKFLKKLITYLSFGLKSADSEMFDQKENIDSNDSSINQVQEQRNVYKDLRKGEVTQEVEELRYSSYNVYRESDKYQYLGDGVATKKEVKKDNGNYNFTLHNNLVCDGVLDSFNKLENDTFDINKFTLSIQYFDIPRFRLERFCKMIEVNIESGKAKIRLHFSAFYDSYDSTSKSFLNELNKLEKLDTYYAISKNELCSNINNLSFTTYKANGEDDLINYTFTNLQFIDYQKNYFEHVITYNCDYERVDLLDKYYSKSMDMKYKNKESKNSCLDLTNSIREEVCSLCGENMSVYDADITKETLGYSICTKCLEKNLTILDK